MIEINPQEVNLSNGAPYTAPKEKETVDSNKAFYATALSNSEDPLETYLNIMNEARDSGHSSFIESLELQFQKEENEVTKVQLENIIVDPDLQPQQKKEALESYLYKNQVPVSLQEKYAERLSNEYILENNLDQSEEALIEQDDKEELLVIQSAWDDVYNKAIEKKNKPSTLTLDENVEKLTDPEYFKEDNWLENMMSSTKNNVAFVANMIFGEGFPWIVDITESFEKYYLNNLTTRGDSLQLPQQKAFGLLLDYLKEGTGSIDQKKVKRAQQVLDKEENQYGQALSNLTKIYDYISTRNRGIYDPKDKGLANQWAEFFKQTLEDQFDITDKDLNETLSADLLLSLDTALNNVAEKYSPNDPMLLRLPLELAIGFLGPKGIKYTYKGAKYGTKVAVVGRPGAKLISNIEKANLSSKPYATPTPIQIQASKEVQIKANSPIATTLVVNPKKASKLIAASLEDKTMQFGDVVFNNTNNPTWTARTMIMHLTDGNSKMFSTNNFGWIVDSSILKELQLISEYNTIQRFLPEGARDISQRRVELDTITSGLNGVDPSIRMIPSKTFSVMDETSTGFETRLVFRASSSEDYKTIFEAADSYNELKRSLKDNLELDENALLKEISIVEYDANNNVIRIINESNIKDVLNNEPSVKQGFYRVEWKRDYDLYEGFFGKEKMTLTPNDRFPGIKGFILRALYNLGSSKTFGSYSDILTRYGKFAKEVENAFFSQDLAKEAFFKTTLERLQQLYKKEMNTLEQRQFGIILRAAETAGKDRLSGGDINSIIGNGRLTSTQVQKFLSALNAFRIVTNELHVMRQVIARKVLLDRGYKQSFYYIDPDSKLRVPMAVKDEFQFIAQDDFIDVISQEGELFSYEIWDFKTNKAILHRPSNQNQPGTHFLQLKDGTPTQQIYQLANRFKAPDGNYYSFGTFGTVKPGPLPKEISPRIKGYIPKIHEEAIIVKRIPLVFKNNGRLINYQTKREDAPRDLDAYSESVAMFVSRKDAEAYKRKQEEIYGTDFVYTVDTVAELKSKNRNFSDEQIRKHNLQVNKARTGIKYQLEDDPYSSLIRTAQITGGQVLDIVGIGQLKTEFVKAIENNKNIRVDNKNPDGSIMDPKGVGRIEDRYPTREQIKEVAGQSDTYKHFLKLWDEIYIYEMGKARGSIANITAKLGEWVAEGSDFVAGETNIGKTFVKGARWIQRNPQSAAGAPLKPITSLWIMMRPIKQFILQSMASLGPIAVVSNGNPVQMGRLYLNASRLIMTRIANQRNMGKGKNTPFLKKDLEQQIENFWNLSDPLLKELGNDVPTNKFQKITIKDLEYIDQWARKSGASNVRDHVYNQGLGVNTIPNLTKFNTAGTPIHKLRGANVASYLNPFMYLEKSANKFSEWGFELGESINRDLFIMVALEQFKAKNPGKNWKSNNNMSQIMLDANRLAGGMNNTMAFSWQGVLPLRYLGLFTSFSMKMSERTWNASATPFTGRQRAGLLAADFMIYGSTMYNFDKFLRNWLMESEDPDLRTWGEYFSRLNLTYQAVNLYGKYLGNESAVVPGEVLSVHGNAPLGPLTNVIRLVASWQGDTIDTKELGATVAFYKKILGDNGAVRLLFDLYGNSDAINTPQMKLNLLKTTLTEMIPFLSMLDKMTFAILEDEFLADQTRTGHDTGLETTPYEQVMRSVLGAQDSRTQLLWDQTSKNRDKKKFLRSEARRVVKIYRDATGRKEFELEEVKNFLTLWKLKLENETMITNTIEHQYFMDQGLLIITQQDNTFAEKFYNEFKKSFNYSAPYYSESTVEQIRNLKIVLQRKFPDSIEELDEMEAHMLSANDAYKKENE